MIVDGTHGLGDGGEGEHGYNNIGSLGGDLTLVHDSKVPPPMIRGSSDMRLLVRMAVHLVEVMWQSSTESVTCFIAMPLCLSGRDRIVCCVCICEFVCQS